jgi:hypothetical protein
LLIFCLNLPCKSRKKMRWCIPLPRRLCLFAYWFVVVFIFLLLILFAYSFFEVQNMLRALDCCIYDCYKQRARENLKLPFAFNKMTNLRYVWMFSSFIFKNFSLFLEIDLYVWVLVFIPLFVLQVCIGPKRRHKVRAKINEARNWVKD